MGTLIELLHEEGVKTKTIGQHHHARDGWVQIDCPFCGRGTGKYHLGVRLSDGRTNCWRCGYHRLGDVLVALGLAVGALRGLRLDTKPPAEPRPAAKTGRLSLGPLLDAHRRYVVSRGFNPAEIEQLWGIRGIGIASRLAWRIWIPVHLHGQVVSWTTRAIGSTKRRYISASPGEESIPIKKLLYGADLARHSIVIVEGPLDAWRIGPGAVALFGLTYTRAQILAMLRFPVRAVCLDAQPVAQRVARRLVATLSMFPGETHLIELESAKDAADANIEEIVDIRRRFIDCSLDNMR